MEKYEEVSYGSQVELRGLTDAVSLKKDFERRYLLYNELVGHKLRSIPLEGRCISLACGYGNFMFFLTQKGFSQVVGYDLDQKQVDLARSIGLEARCGDAVAMISLERNVQLIDAFDFIEHLDKNTVIELLQSIHSVLVPGGMFILQCPCADGFTGAHDLCNDFTHKWCPSSTMLHGLLVTCGFREVEIYDMTLPPNPTGLSRKLKFMLRRTARTFVIVLLKIIGVKPPRIWANSQVAVARK